MEITNQKSRLRAVLIRFFVSGVIVAISLGVFANEAQAGLLSSTSTNTTVINPAGGSANGAASCAADSVVVGFRWSGGTSTSSPYSIYCRALNADGTIPATQSDTTNSTPVTVYVNNTAANVEWCPAGTVATGVRTRGWADFALICNTPPGLGSAPQYSATVTTPTDNSCAASSILVGMGTWTGAWLDSLYGVCKAYGTNTLSYNVNSGSGSAPPSVSPISTSPVVKTSTAYTGTRTGYTFSGWNTAANGTGTNYPVNTDISVTVATTLYAQWNSTITYDGNSNDGGTAPTGTTALSSAAVTQLATNTGSLTRTGYTFAGWNTAANGTGTSYAAGLATYASSGDITLYAQWNSTISYSGNGNTGGSAPASQTAIGQSPLTLRTNTGALTKTSETFAGWNTTDSGSGTYYAVGATNYVSSGNATLYSMWNTTPSVPDLEIGRAHV